MFTQRIHYIIIYLLCLTSVQAYASCSPPQITCPNTYALIVPSQVTESDPSFQAIVCTPESYSQSIEIQLISTDRSEIRCPQSAVMPSHYTWVAIDMSVVDDFIADGPISLSLTAEFVVQTVTTHIKVLDNDQATNQVLEKEALNDFFEQTSGKDWKNNSQWLETDNPCTWHGIQCDNGVMPVSEIHLNDHHLMGQLPTTLNQLADLKRIYLGHNNLSGNFSESFIHTRLHILWLQDNAFSGVIPDHLLQLSFLQDLNISNNQLSGPLPDNIGTLSRLESLDLSSNILSGSLPQSFNQFERLTHLDLHDNQLTGTISALSNLCQLQTLDISNNQFLGQLDDLENLSNIRTMDLGKNHFENVFPDFLAQNTIVLRIDVHDTHLSGQLPQWNGEDYALYALNLRSNRFVGQIPETILGLTNLSSGNLDLRWNALYAGTPEVKKFIDQKHIGNDWEITQTVAPANLTATVLSGESIRLDWTPIHTDTITGAYEIFYGYAPDGPFRKLAETTVKTDSNYTLTRLYSSSTYFFKVRTRTDPHANNRNIVLSDFSTAISATTQSVVDTMAGPNGQISPSGIVSVPQNAPIVFHFIPDANYHVENVLVDRVSIGSVTSYTFSSIQNDRELQATFANDAPSIDPILPLSFDEDAPPAPILLTITDRETSIENLTIKIVSDNQELIPDDHIQITGSGSARYLHLKNLQEMSGVGFIMIKVSDPLGLNAIRAFNYTVNTINDPPVAKNHIYNAFEDIEFKGQFQALDIENDSLFYIVTARPNHGKLTHDAGKDIFTYRSDINYSGRDYIRFKVQDNSKLGPKMSNEAVVVLDIQPVNDAPVSKAGEDLHVLEGERVSLNGSNSYDVDDNDLFFEWWQSVGPEVTLSSSSAISPVFIAPHALSDNQPISLVFWLKVSDDENNFMRDNCIVWVNPREIPLLPIAQMGTPLVPVSGSAPFRVDFQDRSLGMIDSWQWLFGNGHESKRKSPTYTYDNPGVYTIHLQVTGPGGSNAMTYTNWITVLANPNAVSSVIPPEERTVLIDLYNQTLGTEWIWNVHWLNPYRKEYFWYGVTIPDNHVSRLELSENALNGALPENLHQLTDLQHLDLSKNNISGPLPDTIIQLKQLSFLDISHNQLYDTLSSDFNQLKQLTRLNLDYNQFYGSIPQNIGDMQQLQYLNLGKNNLIGTVPVSFSNLNNLLHLDISFNKLNGELPNFLDQIPSLIHLDLSHNSFIGTIPTTLMYATWIEEIRLSFNQLDGPIPDGFERFENLQTLDLSGNQFSGSIPNSLYESSQLKRLNLSHNLLENPLTSRVTLLKQLMLLDISYNRMNGVFPVELTRLDQIQILNLSYNAFSETIPNLSRLALMLSMDISHNHFTGAFPESLFTLQKLKVLNLSGNNFSGEIPETILQMTGLEDNASDFRWNRLTVNSRNVEKFLALKQISGESWINTQTIAPSTLTAKEGETLQELILSWNPIPYTSNEGGYEIYIAQHPDGPYEFRYRTGSKLDNSYTITNLYSDQTYYFKIRTLTKPHAQNPNMLFSDYTPILPFTVNPKTERPVDPSDLAAETYFKNRVMLSWKTIKKPENVYYKVFRSQTIDGQYQCISLPLIDTLFVDWDVQAGANYYYKIRSYIDETPSEQFSNIVHAIPGTPTTYSINGHFTVALVSQGDTAVYSMTLEGASGFRGKIDMECLWPGSDQTIPPSGIDPIFFLSGYVMDTELKRTPLPATIQLKINVAQDYTPSVLIFQLAVTDSQTKNQRLFGMQLHVIPKNECAIALSSDRPIYNEYAPIVVSGFISSRMAKEPVDIRLMSQSNVLSQKLIQTLNDGYFETSFTPAPWAAGDYTIQATWEIWDIDDIFCMQSSYSVSLPVMVEQSTTHIKLSMKPDQQIPKINQFIDILGELSPSIDNSEITVRIIAPDNTLNETNIPLEGQNRFEIPDIQLIQPGIWQIKAYLPGNMLFPGCESNNLEILVDTPPGRAIILGTRYPQYQRQLPQSSFDICKKVYDQFLQRGFDSVEISTLMHIPINDPLTPDPPLESMDWVDDINPTSQDFLDALTHDFLDVVHPHLPLWIFIHGFSESDASFMMRNSYDRLSAMEIDAALDYLQQQTQCQIILILDMPYSGAFIPFLSGTNRVIITSSETENYRVDPTNDLSFSLKFFHYLHKGFNVFQSFEKSKRVWDPLNLVSARLEDNGDGTSISTNGELARQTFMNGPTISTEMPTISDIQVQSYLQHATSLPISVNVTAGTGPISRVKVHVMDPTPPPLYDDISTAVEFTSYTLNASNHPFMYSHVLTCLTEPGTYTLLVLAQDRYHCISDPVSTTVIVAPETPVSYFDGVPDQTRHALNTLCGFFRTDDPNFHQIETPTDYSLRAIWGLHYRHVIAVGDHGTILFFDGNQWKFMESHTSKRLLAVWGTSSDNVYVTGEEGVMRHYNGTIWETIETHIENPLCGIWGTHPDNIYAVGGHGTILHYDGVSWQRHYTQWYDRLNAIWGRNEFDIYAAGENGLMLHFDGSKWESMPYCSTKPVNILFGDASLIFGIRFFDPIQFNAGQGWTPTQECDYQEINTFWRSHSEYVFSAGERGQVSIWSSPASCRQPNTPPMISFISDREIIVNQPVPPIPFTIKDNEHFAYELRLDVMSSNADLLPENRITIEGTSADRLIKLEPIYGKIGKSYISLIVSDPCERKQAQGFMLKVTDHRNQSPHPFNEKIEIEDILEILKQEAIMKE